MLKKPILNEGHEWLGQSTYVLNGSLAELESRLRAVAEHSSARPTLATLAMPDGSAGYIGLGLDESVVFLHGPPGPAFLLENPPVCAPHADLRFLRPQIDSNMLHGWLPSLAAEMTASNT